MKTDKPINTLVREFLEDQDIKPISRKRYYNNLQRWLYYCVRQKVDVRKPRRADVIAFKAWLLDGGKTTATIDSYLTTVRKFFSWLEQQGIYDNVAAGVHSPKKYRGHRKSYMKPEQVSAMLSAMSAETISQKRNFAILNLMVRTGMRRIEVQRLNVSDMYMHEGRPVLRIQRKGHDEKDHVVGINEKVLEPIEEYMVCRDNLAEDDPLFINHSHNKGEQRIAQETISRIIKSAMRAIGIDDKKITAHSLRHTAAITALRSGASLLEVQEMLGHTSVETTRIYLSAMDEEIRLNNPAIRALSSAY